jgi:hypothetical protein
LSTSSLRSGRPFRLQDRFELVSAQLLAAIDHQQDRVGLCAPSQAALTIARSSRRLGAKMPGVSARMIWFAFQRDAHQPRAGGLRLGRDDRHLLADQRVDQRRLARIGRADHGDQAAGLCHPNLFMN